MKKLKKLNGLWLNILDMKSMKETIYLLSSPANATRLYAAIEEAKTRTVQPQTIDELFEELQLDE